MTDAPGEAPAGSSVVQVAVARPQSSWRKLACLGLAGTLFVVSIDLAVETFVAESPVRWIPVACVVGCCAAAGLLWRRLSATAFGWLALFALLTILTLTSWMGGTTEGVVAFRQATPRVLGMTAAAGVLLSLVSFLRVKVLPLPGKALVGLLALYALWALGWGIILQTPYPTLLHGGSSWQRLPYWLQGAFIGVIVLIPAGLLARFVSVRSALRAGRAGAWLREVTALTLVAATASSGIGVHLRSSGAASAPPTGNAYAPLPSAPPMEPTKPPASYEDARARLDHLIGALKELTSLADPGVVDIGARAQKLGPGIEPAFTFARSSIRTEAYVGVLRGARGALLSAAGNPVDKSLLLSALLREKGFQTRIVSGTIGEAAVDEIITHSDRAAVDPPSYDGTVNEVIRRSGEPELLARIEATRSHAERLRAWVAARSDADATAVRSLLGNGAWFKDEAATTVRQQLRQHCWVQVLQGSAWVDLDPSLGTAVGQRRAEVQSTVDDAHIPAGWFHTVRFTLKAERSDGKKLTDRAVLDKSVPAQDLFTQQIRFTNSPVDTSSLSDLKRMNRFRASLSVGKRREAGAVYTLDEAGASPAMPDIGGALFGAEAPAPAEAGQQALTGLWLEIALVGPGTTPKIERRYFIDRYGRELRRKGLDGATPRPMTSEELALSAIRTYDIVVMPGPLPEFAPGWLLAKSMLENQQLLSLALEVRFGRAAADSLRRLVAQSQTLSPTLMTLAGSVSERLRRPAGATHLVLQQPFVAMKKQALKLPRGATAAQGTVLAEEAFDIVSAGAVALGGERTDRASAGIDYGAFLTNVELAATRQLAPPGVSVSNTSALMEAARSRGESLSVLSRQGDEGRLGLSGDSLAAVGDDLRDGYAVVACPRGQSTDTAEYCWWRVSPSTGVALGVSESGEGRSATEEALMLKAGVVAAVATMVWCQVKNENIAEHDAEQGTARLVVGQAYCIALGGIGVACVLGPSIFLIALGVLLGMGGDLCGLY